jgi:hypothetical protein
VKRRLGDVLIGIGAAFTLSLLVFGGAGAAAAGLPIAGLGVAMIVTGVVLRRPGRRSGGAEHERWQGSQPAPAPRSMDGPDGPDVLDGKARPAGRAEGPTGRGRRAVLALGRIEGRELLANPWFAVGLGIAVLEVVAFGLLWSSDFSGHWWEAVASMPLAVHPLVGLSLVAAHRGMTRARRDGCEELFTSCPMDEGARLEGHLLTAWVGVVAALALAVVLPAVILRGGAAYGALDGRALAIMATCGVLGAGGVVLGVALGRWAPFLLTPLVALIAIVAVSDRLLDIGAPRWSTDRLLATFDPLDGPDPLLLDLPLAERLLWFGALTTLVAGAALLGRRRWATPLVVGAAAVSLLAAVAVTAPMSDPAALAAPLLDPATTERCVRAGTATAAVTVEVCGPPVYAGGARRYADGLTPLVDALPAESVGRVQMRQRLLDENVEALPAELAAVLPAAWSDAPNGSGPMAVGIGPDRIVLPVPVDTLTAAVRGAQFRLAAQALGLPVETEHGAPPMVVAGRADGLAVLWLGTLGLDADRRAGSITPKQDDHADEPWDDTTRGHAWPDPCVSGGPAPLTWAPQDIEAATRLFALPDDQVRAVLHEHWHELDELTTDDLLAVAGLDPVGPTAPVEERPHVCTWL